MSTTELAKSLDDDFLYYLDFTKDYPQELYTGNERKFCKLWLDKLCSEIAHGIQGRRTRNLWMSRLVVCIHEGALNDFFLTPPEQGPLPEYPKLTRKTVESPAWLDEIVTEGISHMSRDGRTYLATQKLEDGRGAFAYLAVTLNDGEPEWLPQAGRDKLKQALSEGFDYALGDISQPNLATVIASRKTLQQRKAVLDYYNNILDNISGQLGGYIKEGSCDVVNDLMIRMISGLRKEGRYKNEFLKYPRRERYFRLLEKLAYKIKDRIYRIERREILLDEVERRLLSDSLFSASFSQETRVPWKGAEWWKYIGFRASADRMKMLQYLYPPELVETFRILLEREKWSLGERSRREHVNFVAQLNMDLERERQLGEDLCDKERDAVSELEAAIAVCDGEARAALAPAKEKLLRDIAETELLLEKMEEENNELLNQADDLAQKAGL